MKLIYKILPRMEDLLFCRETYRLKRNVRTNILFSLLPTSREAYRVRYNANKYWFMPALKRIDTNV